MRARRGPCLPPISWRRGPRWIKPAGDQAEHGVAEDADRPSRHGEPREHCGEPVEVHKINDDSEQGSCGDRSGKVQRQPGDDEAENDAEQDRHNQVDHHRNHDDHEIERLGRRQDTLAHDHRSHHSRRTPGAHPLNELHQRHLEHDEDDAGDHAGPNCGFPIYSRRHGDHSPSMIWLVLI